MLITNFCPRFIPHGGLKVPKGKLNSACFCTSEDKPCPEVTSSSHVCQGKRHTRIYRLKCILLLSLTSVMPSFSGRFYRPSIRFSVYIRLSSALCVCAERQLLFEEEEMFWLLFSSRNGGPISWLLGLLTGGQSGEPVGVLGWTLWLDGHCLWS